jgi:glutamyl-Q tRNA(Asp) synthetase
MIVTRFAPSPTGRLHLGHAYSAVLGHERARSGKGKFLVRIEDLDQIRCRQAFVEMIMEDLAWLGVQWDDPVLVQSRRADRYRDALERLRDKGLLYPCFCTRSDIAAALEAPHERQPYYPGTCRTLADDPSRRALMPHSWRLDASKALELTGLPEWKEADGRRFSSTREDFDDVILARKDAPAAYHIASVVDDGSSGVTLVTRGEDLRASTPIQRLLQILLNLPQPTYLHHPLVAHDDGRRLAKRDLAPTLSEMRRCGASGPALAAGLLRGKLPLGFAFVEA